MKRVFKCIWIFIGLIFAILVLGVLSPVLTENEKEEDDYSEDDLYDEDLD